DQTLGSVTAGQVDKDVPRFDPNNPGEEVVGFTTPAGCALISKPSEGAKQLANEAAKLIISGNKASQGGGIGSNGGVVIGNEGEYSLKVNKAWAEDIPESSRCAVTIKLKITGIALDGDTVVLDEGNNWSAEFTGLPQPPQLIDCTVIEDPLPAGFAPEVSEAVFNETDKSYTITVTNKKAPAPTPTPTPGGGYEPTPTPFIIVPPKTGDGGFFRMLLSFLGFGK
ncbi:MAG: Cna B-type domain-containing protein, partial [Clostridiales bacterium]|nr:Cna B-type domain-containing protein [Clostridiales bacterium]